MQGKKTSFGPLSLFTIINNVYNWLHLNDVLVQLDGIYFCLVFYHLIKSFKVICCTNI